MFLKHKMIKLEQFKLKKMKKFVRLNYKHIKHNVSYQVSRNYVKS